MTEYTPSDKDRAYWSMIPTDRIRDGFATIENQGSLHVSRTRRAAFDAWLAAHDTRIARAAWSEGAHTMTTGDDTGWIDEQNPYRETP